MFDELIFINEKGIFNPSFIPKYNLSLIAKLGGMEYLDTLRLLIKCVSTFRLD